MEKRSSSEESETGQQHHHRLPQSDNDDSTAEPSRRNKQRMLAVPPQRRIFPPQYNIPPSDPHLVPQSIASSIGDIHGKYAQQEHEDSLSSSNEDDLESHTHYNQTALAASLPVAASFHPAELFANTTPPVDPRAGNTNLQNDISSTRGMLNATTEQALRLATSSQFHIMPSNLLLSHQASIGADPFLQGYPQTGSLSLSSFRLDTATNQPTSMSIVAAALEDIGRRRSQSAITVDNGRRKNDDGNPNLLSNLMSAASMNSIPPASLSGAASSANQDEEQQSGGNLRATRQTRGEEIFPMTLHRLLMDLENIEHGSEIARFILPHGRSFIVEDTAKFESEIMPKYFPKMNRLSSFQRQLNLYNFARVLGNGPDRGAYYHEFFVRDKPELACTIRRTKIKGRFTVPLEKRRNRRKQLGSPPSKSPEQPTDEKGDA